MFTISEESNSSSSSPLDSPPGSCNLVCSSLGSRFRFPVVSEPIREFVFLVLLQGIPNWLVESVEERNDSRTAMSLATSQSNLQVAIDAGLVTVLVPVVVLQILGYRSSAKSALGSPRIGSEIRVSVRMCVEASISEQSHKNSCFSISWLQYAGDLICRLLMDFRPLQRTTGSHR